jgi:hypothetical protein
MLGGWVHLQLEFCQTGIATCFRIKTAIDMDGKLDREKSDGGANEEIARCEVLVREEQWCGRAGTSQLQVREGEVW